MSDVSSQEVVERIDPAQALELAQTADEHKVKRNFGGEPSPLPEYKDTIVALREKNYTFEMVSEFLKRQCGIARGAGPQSIRNFLVEEGLYEPPVRKKVETSDEPAETDTSGGY